MDQSARDRFESLYEAHYRPVRDYMIRRLGDAAAAEDLTEDVFLVAWGKLEGVPSGVEGKYWLFGVARRILSNHHRRAATARRLSPRLRPPRFDDAPTPEQRALEGEDAAVVRAAIARLRPKDRELIRLAYWDELPHAEIAGMLGCSRGTVDVRLHRAVQRLGKALTRSRHFWDEESPEWAPEETAC